MPEPIGIWTHSLRNWQRECHRTVDEAYERGKRKFLAEACPGGGKTTSGLHEAFFFLQLGYAKRIEIVVHTEHLKRQWAEAAHFLGLDIDPYFQTNGRVTESDEYHGIAVTYQQIMLNPHIHRQRVNQASTIVIFDEIHHAGDQKTWGDSIKYVYENAVFKLALSGTAFRSDNSKIPFVTYKDGISKADFRYSYSQALKDGVCRPIYFPAYDGLMKWVNDGKQYSYSFTDFIKDEGLISQRLRTALDPDKSEWLQHVIRDADTKLNEIREVEHHSDAGGLILAIDQLHAKKIADLVLRITDTDPELVISEDSEASNKIKRFRESTKKWIVAVRMISEGVDIPRLRVGIHANNITQDLFFRQEVGRYIRMQQHLAKQDAYLYIPMDPRITKLAQEIEVERDHALGIDNEEKEKQERERTDDKEFEAVSAIVTEQKQFELSFSDRIGSMFNIPGSAATGITRKVLESKEERQKRLTEEDNGPLFEKKLLLRKEINKKAKIAAKNKFNGSIVIDWQYFHKEWIKMGGRPIEEETYEELIKRDKWLDGKL